MNRKIKRPDLTNLREQMKQEREDVTALAAIEKPLIGSTDIDLSLANLTTDENINKILKNDVETIIKLCYNSYNILKR